MGSNICRIFTLYHDRCSFDASGENIFNKEKDLFINIGYYDWVKTQRFKLCNAYDCKDIYNYNIELSNSISKYQSYQNMYGFLYLEEEDIDSLFWNEKNSPIMFITAVQFEDYQNEISEKLKEVLKKWDKCKTLKYLCYKTLDNYDLIICSRSDSYRELINFVNTIYLSKDYRISYMYTNFIVNYKELNDENFKDIVRSEIIDSICIKAVFNCETNLVENGELTGKLNYINRYLSEKLYGDSTNERRLSEDNDHASYEILGEMDCRYIAREVYLYEVLSLFKKGGVLDRHNDKFNYMFLSTMTSLNIKLINCNSDKLVAEYEKSLALIDKEKGSNYSIFNDDVFSNLETALRIIKDSVNAKDQLVYTQLHTIVNYLSYINNQPYPKHQLLLLSYTKTIINILVEKTKKKEKSSEIREVYDYINYIYSDIMENSRTNIRSFQVSNFSIATYYAPAKLRAFYLIIINKISEFYKSFSQEDKDVAFDFITIPTNKSTTNVSQAWKNEIGDDKLMVAHITEKDFYNIKDLLIQEAHEAAHFVGNNAIRNRKKRFEIVVDYWINKIYVFFSHYISELKEDLGSDKYNFIIIPDVDYNSFHDFSKKKANNLKDEIIDNKFGSNKQFFYYSENTKKYIYKIFSFETISYMLTFLFTGIKKSIKICNINAKLDDVVNAIHRVEEMEDYVKKEISVFIDEAKTKKNFNSQLMILMSECYSDLSAIVTFNLDAEDYFESVFNHIANKENLRENSLFNRACVITAALSRLKSVSTSFEIKNNTYYRLLNDTDETDNTNCSKVIDKHYRQLIKEVYQNFYKNKDSISFYLLQYIEECLNSYANFNYLSNERNELIDIYDNVSTKNIYELISSIDSIVYNCITDISNRKLD